MEKVGLMGPELPEPAVAVAGNAWDLSYRLIQASEQPVTLIATEPLTNLGILLTAHPDVKDISKKLLLWAVVLSAVIGHQRQNLIF